MFSEAQEIQGPYGTFSLSERVLQKIWLQGDFEQVNLRTESGKSLRVVDPGRWNLLEGPDFLEARLHLDGREIVADVEIHFYASDWNHHGHNRNPKFSKVRLHVVLYPDREGSPEILTEKGDQPETLCLIPLLNRDLEACALDDALLQLERVEYLEWKLHFLSKEMEERHEILREAALSRWEQKKGFARKRLNETTWVEACHQYCLEVLGYSGNRDPMSRIALEYSPDDFAQGRIDIESVFERLADRWKLNGLRPANHPRQRLLQYRELCRLCPDWPVQLSARLQCFEDTKPAKNGALFRKVYGLHKKTKAISAVFGNKISAKRLNTLICDAILPLAAAADITDPTEYWLHWPAGDAPGRLYHFLKNSGTLTRKTPFSNGHLQGLIQLLLNVPGD